MDTSTVCAALLSQCRPRHCLFCKRGALWTCADSDIWDPENDAFLPLAYDHTNVVEGKQAARQALRERLGLTGWGDKPIIGVVTRLTAQKGRAALQHRQFCAEGHLLAGVCLCTVRGKLGTSPEGRLTWLMANTGGAALCIERYERLQALAMRVTLLAAWVRGAGGL